MAKKMVLTIASGGYEKLVVAGVFVSGAVAQDMDVEVFLLLGGAYAFRKEVAEKYDNVVGFKKEELFEGIKNVGMPHWLKMFQDAKELGNVKIHVCSTAGKIWGASKLEDFVDIVDDLVGITECINATSEADVSYIL